MFVALQRLVLLDLLAASAAFRARSDSRLPSDWALPLAPPRRPSSRGRGAGRAGSRGVLEASTAARTPDNLLPPSDVTVPRSVSSYGPVPGSRGRALLKGGSERGGSSSVDQKRRRFYDSELGVEVLPAKASRPSCPRASEEALSLAGDEVELIFVRHGLSLNNVFAENMVKNVGAVAATMFRKAKWKETSKTRFKRGYATVCKVQKLCGPYTNEQGSSLDWEIREKSRDCLLHPEGEEGALELQELLAQALPANVTIGGFFASPLRRTLQTLLTAFGSLISERPQSEVGVQPWAHERYLSDSDLAWDGHKTADFLAVLRRRLLGGDSSDYSRASRAPKIQTLDAAFERVRNLTETFDIGIRSLKSQLCLLGNWQKGFGNKSGDPTEAFGTKGGHKDLFPFYPHSKSGSWKESDKKLQRRMRILRRWMKTLKPGTRYVLVSHGGIAEALFHHYFPENVEALSNLGIVLARFKPGTANADDGDAFFDDVTTARQKWGCSSFPGWQTAGSTAAEVLEPLVDLTFNFAPDLKTATFPNGIQYMCCCSVVERRIECKLEDAKSQKVIGYKGGCGGLAGKGFHSWNSMSRHRIHHKLANAGRCVVPASRVPPMKAEDLVDVTSIFEDDSDEVTLSDGEVYRCCCQSVGSLGKACTLKVSRPGASCPDLVGTGFFGRTVALSHLPLKDIGKCIVVQSRLPAALTTA